MLINLLIALIAVLGFALFEWIHLKAAYSFKTAWFKYVLALVLGALFQYLIEWKYFQWLETFAFVVAFLYFFWVILGALKVKKPS